jgi:hypothetical protein
MESDMIARLKALVDQRTAKKYIEAEDILLAYLESNRNDIDGWLLLTRIEWNSPLQDPFRIIEYTNNIFTLEPLHPYALLFVAEAYDAFLGEIDSATLEKLYQVNVEDGEIMAMIEIAKARYFEHKDKHQYQQALERSVQYSMNQQINCADLGLLYFNQGKQELGKSLIKRAIGNVKNQGTEKWDAFSMECWFDYYYKGTHLPAVQYEWLLDLLAKCEAASKE